MDTTETTAIPMNGKMETPLTDGATWKTDSGIEVVHRQFASGLEQQLYISRRSVVVLQSNLEEIKMSAALLIASELGVASAQVGAADALNRKLLGDIALLNERLRERAESFNEADARRIHRIQELEAQLPTACL